MDNKTLLDSVARQMECPLEQVSKLQDVLCEVIARAMLDSDVVAVPSFGNFEPKKRLERVTVHPSTGKRMLIPPKMVVGFKPSAILKTRIRPEKG